MTRVSNFAQSRALIADALRTQERIFEAQRQVTSGKRADQYADIPRETGVLLGVKSILTRSEQFKITGAQLGRRLNTYDLVTGELALAAENLRQEVLGAISTNLAPVLMDQVRSLFQRTVSLLNTSQDGIHLFGGTRTDTPPVNIATVDDLLALGEVSQAFDNNQQKVRVRVDEGLTLTYGLLADEVGTELFEAIRRIAQFDAGPDGPIRGALSEAQREFLTTEINKVKAALDGLNEQVALVGTNAQIVDRVAARHDEVIAFSTQFISDIEDADITLAVTNLNDNQLALQASFRVLSQMMRNSLLDYI